MSKRYQPLNTFIEALTELGWEVMFSAVEYVTAKNNKYCMRARFDAGVIDIAERKDFDRWANSIEDTMKIIRYDVDSIKRQLQPYSSWTVEKI